MARTPRTFPELPSRYARCASDETDGDTDDQKPDGWYPYPPVGPGTTPGIRLARAIGGEVLSVSVTGAEAPELRLRTGTPMSALASVRSTSCPAGPPGRRPPLDESDA